MRKSYFPWINRSLALASLFILLLFSISGLFYNHSFERPEISKKTHFLPKNAFQLPEETYKQLTSPALALHHVAPDLLLPDLRVRLSYFGSNQRPDAGKESRQFYFSIGNIKTIYSAKPEEKIYLIRDNSAKSLTLSPHNQPTSIWFVAKPQNKGALIDVYLLGVNGKRVTEPGERVQFFLPEKTLSANTAAWSIENQKVDSTLLFRQKARWHGQDLFLGLFGGQAFAYTNLKQRIDFGEGEDHYVIFASPGEYFIWKNHRWTTPSKNEMTQNYPLLSVRKMDEKTLNLEVWSVGGQFKVPFTLVRSPDPMPNEEAVLNNFEFLGARTKIHFMFKVDGVREIVGPGDWFILQDGKWRKIKKAKDVDLYAEGNLIGPLLVISKGQTLNDRQLSAQLFNASRTNVIEIGLPLGGAHDAQTKKARETIPNPEESIF
ncbi:MAG: hypothetical protein ACSNEK_03550 [Parachlamydiaceae bacterium]